MPPGEYGHPHSQNRGCILRHGIIVVVVECWPGCSVVENLPFSTAEWMTAEKLDAQKFERRLQKQMPFRKPLTYPRIQ